MDEAGEGLRRRKEDVNVRAAMGLTTACLERAAAERRRNIVDFGFGAVVVARVGGFEVAVAMLSQRQPYSPCRTSQSFFRLYIYLVPPSIWPRCKQPQESENNSATARVDERSIYQWEQAGLEASLKPGSIGQSSPDTATARLACMKLVLITAV